MALSKTRSGGLSNSRRTSSGGVKMKRDTYGPQWYTKVNEIRRRDGKKCLDCGATEKLHTHHIIPLSKGGLTANSNLILLCHDCHAKRHRHHF